MPPNASNVREGTILSFRLNPGPPYMPGITPSKLGWGPDDQAYPDKFVVNPTDKAEMVYVPAGEFQMGSPEDQGQSDEHPLHRVSLDGFWIYKYEVTVAQYRAFCDATGGTMPAAPSWGWNDDHPMVKVIWDEAAAYGNWAGVSLPTEAQWEKAARGTDGRIYPWGNEWDMERCNSIERGKEATVAVGSFPEGASPYGAQDMAGNIWEWCRDWYDASYYNVNAAENPENTTASSDGTGCLRGGSWDDGGSYCRAANRNWNDPTNWGVWYGFRCVAE